jgi:MFS family permease
MTHGKEEDTVQTTGPAATGHTLSPRLWGLLLVLACNMLVDALEVSALLVAVPAISQDFRLAAGNTQWPLTGFAIGFGGLLLFAQRLVDRFGRRRVYLVGLAAFAAASLAAAAASTLWLLLLTRLIKGLCAAMTAPTGLAIIAADFPAGPARDRAVSVYTLFGAAGFSAGLVLSGLLTGVGWRLTLASPAPVVAVLFAAAFHLIPKDRARSARRRLDSARALMFTAALLLLVHALTVVPRAGLGSPSGSVSAVVAAAAVSVWIVAERSRPDPLWSLPAGGGTLVRSALSAAALNGSHLGLLLVLSLQLQLVRGWSAFQTALALLPAALPLFFTALASGRMLRRWGAPFLIAVGTLPPCLGCAWYLAVGTPGNYVRDVLPCLLLIATGFVLSFAALNSQAMADVPADRRGVTVGVYQTAVQLGAVFVPAAVAALLEQAADGGPLRADVEHPRAALALTTAVAAAGWATALTGLRRRAPAVAVPRER